MFRKSEALVLAIGIAAIAPGVPAAPKQTPRQGILLRLVDDVGRVATVVVASDGTGTVTTRGLPSLRLRTGLPDNGLIRLQASLDGAEPSNSDPALWTAGRALAIGETTHLQLGGYVFDVQWIGVTAPSESGVAGIDTGPATECCVVCDGIKICGCRVEAPCGTCCAKACGGCGDFEQ